MHVSLNWLKDFVDIPKKLSSDELGNLLTLKTAEVEQVEPEGLGLDGVVVGEILEFSKVPDSDKLHQAKVDVGKKEPIQLIFGSMVTMKVGNKVPVAVAPTTLPSGVEINEKKIRGVVTQGMLCLDQELGLASEGVTIQYFPDLKPGTPIREALNLTDTILEFDNKSLTHRPDLWGHYGIAREVAAITGNKLNALEPSPKIPEKGESPKVEIKNFDLCPRYCGLIINNIKVEESPDWLKKRLLAVGHGVHNNIVDVTNYIVAELGQPMHAFDKNFIEEGIIVRRAEKDEKMTTLDDKERQLTDQMLVIADHKKSVAIAGVMGGQNSEIKAETTSIILESATFNGGSIRRTSTKLGLRTDAVQRFEKSLDPELAELAIKRAAEIILEICPGAEIAGPITDIQKYDKTPLVIELDNAKARSKIGIEISNKEIQKILESLEFQVKEDKKDHFQVTVPSFRATKDVTIEDDLIEEVARMYGYDNIDPELPLLPIKVPLANTERFKKHRARELFSYGLGFSEACNYSFYGKNDLARCQMSEEGHLKLLNYLSEDQTHMRTTLIPNLLKNLQHNVKYQDAFRIYEIGRTYKEVGEFMPLEEKQIVGAIVQKGKGDDSFYEAKGAVEAFFQRFKLPRVKPAADIKDAPYAHPVKSISYIDKNAQTIAQVFMLHPVVAKNHDLGNYTVAIFKINFTEALRLAPAPDGYTSLPKFPSIEFDVSVVIGAETEVGKIKSAIKRADQNLITNIELFDIYQGENLDKGQKAVAYKITLQTPDRTLTDAEMSEVQSKVFQNLEKLGGTIRGKA
jgi:phenylalanyl-tRNA synthetase beta chain